MTLALMSSPESLRLSRHGGGKNDPDDWTFNKAQTRELTHCFHDYPARMIPQVAGKILDTFGSGSGTLFDPCCGTGTSLVEGMVMGLKTVGTDINPLARLIAEAKTSPVDIEETTREMERFRAWIFRFRTPANGKEPQIQGIDRAEFWFKPDVSAKLGHIKKFINSVNSRAARRFFQVAFSETVRESSNTRNGEFKLYRYDNETLESFNPDVFGIMLSKLHRNIRGAAQFNERIKMTGKKPAARVHGFDSCDGIPGMFCPDESVDIVVTSPPYGDSPTTVAYGQYSRLSAAWLGLEGAKTVDRNLMGGKTVRHMEPLPCEHLNEAIEQVSRRDKKRALSVFSFYRDLRNSIRNVGKTVKKSGCACYVVGNRKVKGVVLPTNEAIVSFFENTGFEHVRTFTRSIPNKRMPLKNSPANVRGLRDDTMTKEFIVVVRKK